MFALVATPVAPALAPALIFIYDLHDPEAWGISLVAVAAAAMGGGLFGRQLVEEADSRWPLWILPGVLAGSLALAVTSVVSGIVLGGPGLGLAATTFSVMLTPVVAPAGMLAAYLCARRARTSR